ncbi:hypothetical protein AMIS_66960 [Actinoplanes missouriensis 431]|uniref:Uncharacterized protein n=1 Tax=Actinoplanes missouriensis (strain ATCC 14538 / DSM 43046 / CBS 188.64 / JCM 3121 / NBRC 102363 / NCIMB 12654 / NRRL B-3342 / UNCC 431) TaxID=512565 RepID=I0HFX9_ACTM4|nr:hypothetical protein [Actinoplanes missouriensis]BAL91916.1 hypothetical protein AMIS_66960 [Actinoplanes missouriensis 431]
MTAAPARRPGVSDPVDTSAWWWATWRDLMPRRSIRIDRRRDHSYSSAEISEIRPGEDSVPYAIYLADWASRYRLLALDLDLDAKLGDVEDDCHHLRALLDAAGVAYIVAASGPGGGRHIWSAWPDGLTAEQVRRLGTTLPRVIPALDPGCLSNPKTGCVRPIGAPHRRGGMSELLPEWSVADAIAILRGGNPSERLSALMDALPTATSTGWPTVRDDQHGAVDDERRQRLVVAENGHPMLAGTRLELSPETLELLYSPIPASADANPITWRCLTRLVIARYSADDVTQLLRDPAAHGLEHLRSSRGAGRGPRVPRSPETVAAMLTRQWAKAVDAVVGMLRGVSGEPDEGLLELVASVQAMADSVAPSRWARQAGPADRLVLDAVCLLVLDHNRAQVGASVRRVAELAGLGVATVSRALSRLSQPDGFGCTWLVCVAAASGNDAAIWQLTNPSNGGFASIGMHVSCTGGTQGNPPPGFLRVHSARSWSTTDLMSGLHEEQALVITQPEPMGPRCRKPPASRI